VLQCVRLAGSPAGFSAWDFMDRPEQQIQKAVVQHLRQRGVPGLVFLHPNNNIARRGRRGAIQGGIAKGMGVRAGASDLLLWRAGHAYALELKAPGGATTEAQDQFLMDMDRAGAFTCVCEGLDRALGVLEQWGLLKGQAK
jgi:hypothetical protein